MNYNNLEFLKACFKIIHNKNILNTTTVGEIADATSLRKFNSSQAEYSGSITKTFFSIGSEYKCKLGKPLATTG